MKIQVTQKQNEDINQFYDLINADSGIVEAFFIKPDGTKATHFYDDKGKFLEGVVAFNSKGFTCYAGIQPRDKKLIGSNKASSGKNIIGLRYLYLDLDPVRPKKKNATDAEKKCCLEAALHIQGIFSDIM